MSEVRLIDANALKEEVNKKKVVGRFNTLLLIDNAPTVEIPVARKTNPIECKKDMAFVPDNPELYDNMKARERTQGEYVDISKLRLMTVEECAGHTIDYAMGWKACVEWIKKGGAE